MATKTLVASGVLYTDRRDFYITPQQTAMLYRGATPFLSNSLARASGQMVGEVDYKMFEHRAGWRYQYFDLNDASPNAWSAATPGGTATNTVDNATGVTIDSSLIGTEVEIWNSALDTYKGIAFVTAVSGNDVTLKILGNPTSTTESNAALADNDRFYVMGTAFGETSSSPESHQDELEVVWNSAQMFRTSLKISTTLRDVAGLRGSSDELARIRTIKSNEHRMKIARAVYFGHRVGGIGGVAYGADSTGATTDSTFVNHQTDASSDTVRTTMGIMSALQRYGRATDVDQQNVFSFAKARFSYNDWVTMTQKWSQYEPLDGSMKELYAGPGMIEHFAKLGVEGFVGKKGSESVKLSISDLQVSTIGVRYNIITTPFGGPIRLIHDPLLRSHALYHNWGMLIDPSRAGICQFKASQYRSNIDTNNAPEYQKDEYFDYLGTKFELMESHGLLKLT